MARDPNGSKALSERQEQDIAEWYGGTRSPSSGGAETDEGDVRTETHLYECKLTGSPSREAKSISLKVADIEKARDEAYGEGLEWAMPLRIYAPFSPAANRHGYIDLMVRPLGDDLDREPDPLR